MSTERESLRLILMCAASFQGGHSRTGGELASFLGVPFPIRMGNLVKVADKHGFDRADIWPWLSAAISDEEA